MPWLGRYIDPFLAGFFRQHKTIAISTMAAFTISTCIESFILPRIMGSIVSHLNDIPNLRRKLLWLLAMYCLAQYMYAVYEECRQQMDPHLHSYIMFELVERAMLKYSVDYKTVNPTALYAKIESVHEYIKRIIFKVFTSTIPEILTMLGICGSFAHMDATLGATTTVLVVLHFLLISRQTTQCASATQNHARFDGRIITHLSDRLANLDVIVSAAHGRGLDQEVGTVHAMTEYRSLLHQAETTCISRQRVRNYTSNMVIIVVVITFIYRLYTRPNKPISAHQMSTLLFTLASLFTHLYYLSHTIPGIVSDVHNLDVYAEFIGELMEAQDAAGDRLPPDSMLLGAAAGVHISVDAVEFGYEGSSEPIFKNLSLAIPVGVAVGLVGKSGSGKTSLVRLIQGHLRPLSGRVRMGQVDVHQLPLGTIAYVNQNTTRLFSSSVRDNIEYGHDPASLPAQYSRLGGGGTLEGYLHHLGLASILPPLDAAVGPGGESLSGGQRQTVHLLRCVLNNRARVVVLDEPTSSLDPISTAAVCRLIGDVASGGAGEHGAARTVLVITHDPLVEKICPVRIHFSVGQNPVMALYGKNRDGKESSDS